MSVQTTTAMTHPLVRYALVLALLGGLAYSLYMPHMTPAGYANYMMTILLQVSATAILAVGVTFVLLTGGVDLSLGSLVALAGVVAAIFARAGQPLAVSIAMGVLAGLACGLVNGAVVVFARVAPFIATLGMMTAARGLALLLSGGKPVPNLGEAFKAIAAQRAAGVPVPVLIVAAVAGLAWLFLRHSRPGRYVYAVGGNEEAARACGLNVSLVKVFVYAVSGALAGLAGVINASRLTTGQPNTGEGFELAAIAAAVIGGTSLSGGVGTIGGALLGALLMGMISSALDMRDVSAYYQQIITGGIIVAAVWLERKGRRE